MPARSDLATKREETHYHIKREENWADLHPAYAATWKPTLGNQWQQETAPIVT